MTAHTLTDAEREALGDWWDDETTVGVESVYPVVARILAARAAEHEAEIERLNEDCRIHLMRRHEVEAERDAAREQVRHMHDVLDRAEAERDEWMERAQGVKVGLIHDATEQITAERDAAEAKHRDLTSRLGFGDGITEPMADNDTIVEHWGQISSEAADHWECPRICELCGEPLADTDCEHCNGSGGGPGTASGAYDECERCAGAGRVHVGCAEKSYADLVAERDAAREALARVEALADGAAYAGRHIQRLLPYVLVTELRTALSDAGRGK